MLFEPYHPDNPFQKIVDGKAPAYHIFEDDKTLAFLDIFPRTRGQILVISRKPARNILTLPEKEVGALFRTVQQMTKLVVKTFNPSGVVIAQLNGEKVGQTVFYVHMHVFPFYGEETSSFLTGKPIPELSRPDALEEVQHLLQKQLKTTSHV